MLRNLRELYQYRALMLNLTQRELRARYRASVLGFLWTFLNPTLQMAVYALLFSVYMRQNMPHYTYFIFVGLLPWIYFSSSFTSGATAISDRRDLLTKVHFPAQVLPATVISTNLANYILSLPLMVGLGLLFGVLPSWHAIVFPLIVLVQTLFTLGLVYLVSTLNVAFRDLQHLVTNLTMLWFFLTPVVYPASNIPDRWRDVAVLLNPMAAIVTSYQAIFYDHRLPALQPLLAVGALSVGLLWVSSILFEARREEFAEYV
jgi:lipopolysaccharide transport system permease protein